LSELKRHLRHWDANKLVRALGHERRGTEVARNGFDNLDKRLASHGENAPHRQLMARFPPVAIDKEEDEFGAPPDVRKRDS
jgi:hypothetical protein